MINHNTAENYQRDTTLEAIAAEGVREVQRAAALGYGAFHSAHEGYAIILEEMDELKAHVWARQSRRDLRAMRAEAVQVMAMAMKFVKSLDEGIGRV